MNRLTAWWRHLSLRGKAITVVVVLVVLGAVSTSGQKPTPGVIATSEPTALADTSDAPAQAPSALATVAPKTAAPTTNIWSRAVGVGTFEGLGFTGKESPLLDGTPRWLARGPNSAIAEVIGQQDQVESISLTVIAGEDGGTLAGMMLGVWLPDSVDWFQGLLAGYSGIDFDESRSFEGGTLRVQTLTVADGALVILSVSR